MKTCIYCATTKPDSEFSSLEHIIPQFLGGGCAPDRFKTRDACTRCNSNLGLFVDGSFPRSWIVANWLTFAGMAAYTPVSKFGPPLMFMGIVQFEMPALEKHEICEGWLGPAGEQVYLIRTTDERFYWYAGGNPISAKQFDARAYFTFSEKSHIDYRRTIFSFRDSFKGEKVRKISCTDVAGFDMAEIGFSKPDDLDNSRIEFLRSEFARSPVRSVSIPTKVDFDHRFMSKLALGIGYALTGDDLIKSDYYQELTSGIWHRDGDIFPKVRGTSIFGENAITDKNFKEFVGLNYAVTLLLVLVAEGIAMTLALGVNHAWTILCAPSEILSVDLIDEYRHGKTLVIYPFLSQCIELTLPEFLSHKLGRSLNSKLSDAEARASLGVSEHTNERIT